MNIDLTGQAHRAPLIPGAYERNTLTHRQPGSMGADPAVPVPIGFSSMDAATIAEREREGGGAPSQRRRKVHEPSRPGPALRGTDGNRSWLRRGYSWFQILRLAHR